MTDSSLRFRVTGDAAGGTAAFRAVASSLQAVKRQATEAKASLAGIKSTRAKVDMDTKAIARAKAEIKRLRDEVSKTLQADVTADTRPAERRIRQLEASIRTLSKQRITPQVDTGGLARVKSGLSSITTGVQRFGAGAADAFKAIGVPVLGSIGVAVAGVATGVTVLGIKTLRLADDLDNAKIAFTQFLGGADRADRFLSGLRGFAAKTPFEFPELVDASKRLLAFNVAGKQVIPLMRTFGDVAALTGTNVNDLVTIYGQMFAKGRVANEELLQFTERGVPAYQILADKLGLSVGEVQRLASEGKLGAAALRQLQVGLDEKFGGGMAKQAKTLSGLISTFKDTIAGTLTDVGDALLPLAKAVFPAIQRGAEGLGTKVKRLLPTIVDAIAGGLQGLLSLPGTLLRGLATVTQGISGMVAGIQRSVASLVNGIATALAGVPLISDADVSGLRKAAEDLNAAAANTDAMGKAGFDRLSAAAASADGKLAPLKAKIEAARRAAQGQIALDVQVQQFNDKIAAADAKIARLKKLRANATLDADKKHFDAKIAAAERDKKRFQDNISTITVDAKIGPLRERVVQAKAKLLELKRKPTTPEIRARISELEAKVRAGKAKLADLNRQRPKPHADLSNAALDRAARAASAKLRALDRAKAIAKAELDYGGVRRGATAAQRSIDGIKGRSVNVDVTVRRRTIRFGRLTARADFRAIDPTGFAGMAAAFAGALPRAGSGPGRRRSAGGSWGTLGSDIFGAAAPEISLAAAAPTVQIVVRDRKLAEFLDVVIDGRAQQATRVQERRQVLQL